MNAEQKLSNNNLLIGKFNTKRIGPAVEFLLNRAWKKIGLLSVHHKFSWEILLLLVAKAKRTHGFAIEEGKISCNHRKNPLFIRLCSYQRRRITIIIIFAWAAYYQHSRQSGSDKYLTTFRLCIHGSRKSCTIIEIYCPVCYGQDLCHTVLSNRWQAYGVPNNYPSVSFGVLNIIIIYLVVTTNPQPRER